MDVVQVQCGRPRQTTTAQKARMMTRRVHSVDRDSGGSPEAAVAGVPVIFTGIFTGGQHTSRADEHVILYCDVAMEAELWVAMVRSTE